MAFKRQIDRLPIIPADAKEHNVTCHFCIVGCGYKAYTWDINKQGSTDPSGNIFKTDLSKQQPAETSATSPSSPTSITTKPRWSTSCFASPAPSARTSMLTRA